MKFGLSVKRRFRGVVCQAVHPETNQDIFAVFLCFIVLFVFFLKTCLRVRKKNFQTTFFPSPVPPVVSRRSWLK